LRENNTQFFLSLSLSFDRYDGARGRLTLNFAPPFGITQEDTSVTNSNCPVSRLIDGYKM